MQEMQELPVTIRDESPVQQNAQAGLLVASDRRTEKHSKFYTIHHAVADQIWSRFHEYSMVTHVAYAGALVRWMKLVIK